MVLLLCLSFAAYQNLLALSRSRWGGRRLSVTLRGVAHDNADDASRQNNLEIIAMLHLRHDEREDEANRQTKKNTQHQRLHLAREESDSHAGDKPLNGGPNNNPHDLCAHCGGEPSRQADSLPLCCSLQRAMEFL